MGLPKVFCVFFSNDLLTSGRGKNKRSENLEKGCAHFMMYITVVGVQKIYRGDTVSYIMTEMLVTCCKRAKRRERIAKLAGKWSFSRGEKSRTTSGTRVARCKLQRALYPPPPPYHLQEEVSFAWILAFHLKSFAWLTAGIRVGWLVYEPRKCQLRGRLHKC